MTSNATIEFACPKCGEKIFKVTAEQKTAGQMTGAICTSCSYILTDHDIRAQAVDVARDKIKGLLSQTFGDAFKKR